MKSLKQSHKRPIFYIQANICIKINHMYNKTKKRTIKKDKKIS